MCNDTNRLLLAIFHMIYHKVISERILKTNIVVQGLANFSHKGPDSEYIKLCRQHRICGSDSPLWLYLKVAKQ
jgi:hypothetical protein